MSIEVVVTEAELDELLARDLLLHGNAYERRHYDGSRSRICPVTLVPTHTTHVTPR